MGLMDRMMDRMIRNMSVQEKEEMMLKMMPLMMKDVDMLNMMPGMMSSSVYGVMNKCISYCNRLRFISRINFSPRTTARLTAG